MDYFQIPIIAAGTFLTVWLIWYHRNRKREKKILQKQIDQLENQLDLSWKHALDPVCVLGVDGRITELNEPFCRLLGRTAGELSGQTLISLIAASSPAGSLEKLTELASNPQVRNCPSLELILWSGQRIFLEVNKYPLSDQDTSPSLFTFRPLAPRWVYQGPHLRGTADLFNLFDVFNDALLVFEPVTEIILAANAKAYLVYGFDKGEMIGQSLKGLTENVERGENQIEKLLEDGTYTNFETVHFRKNGERINILVNSSVIEFEGKTAILSINRDITELKRIQEKLTESERNYRALFENIPDSVFIYARDDHHFLDVNKRSLLTYGYTVEELRQITPFQLHPPEDINRVAENIDRANVDKPNTYRHFTKEGRSIEVEILSNEIIFQGEPAWLSIVRDVTERKRAENALLLQKSRFQQLFENTTLGIAMMNVHETVLDINHAFENIFGFTGTDCRGRNINELIVPPTHLLESRTFQSSTLNRETVEAETLRQRKDGNLVHVRMQGVPLLVGDQIAGLYGIYEDISIRKRMEQDREQLINQLKDALSNIKKLSGLIPICASCKKIRDDQGYWSNLEHYIAQHSEAILSHGICPDCARALYPDYYSDELAGELPPP